MSVWVTTGSLRSLFIYSRRFDFSLSSIPILSLQKSRFLLTSFLSRFNMSPADVSSETALRISTRRCSVVRRVPSHHSSYADCSSIFSTSRASSSYSFLSELVASSRSVNSFLFDDLPLKFWILLISCSFSLSSYSMSCLRSWGGSAWDRVSSSCWWTT